MAQVKITDLTAYADPKSTDVLAAVDVTADITKKVDIAAINKNAALGTDALCGMAFDGDPNTGIFSPGADRLALATAGTGRLFIDAVGEVGIGVSTPDTCLDVRLPAPSATTGNIRITPTTAGQARYQLYNGGATAEWLFGQKTSTDHSFKISKSVAGSESDYFTINSSGNVGIGITSPSDTLHVAGGARFGANDVSTAYLEVGTGATGNRSAFIDLTGDTTYSDFGLRISRGNSGADTNSELRHRGIGSLILNSADSGSVSFRTSDTERARIDSSGRLLIGTSTARVFDSGISATLTPLTQIESTGAESAFSITRNTASATGPGLFLAKSRSAALGGTTIVQNGDRLGTIFFEGTDGTNLIEAASIFSEVDGTPGANDMPGRIVFSTTADGASSPTERMRITQAGDLNYGTGGGIVDPGTGTTDGLYYNNTDKQFVLSRNGGGSLILRRRISDGVIQGFYRDTTLIGTVNVSTTDLTIANSTSGSIVFNRAASSESARIDASGRLLVGTSMARTNLFNTTTTSANVQTEVSGADRIEYLGIRNTNDNNPANLFLAKSRGTTAGSNVIVQNNDGLGQVDFAGSDGAEFVQAASISAQVDGTPGANDMPGRLVFSTTADGAASPTERLRINSAGNVGIGTTSPSYRLHVAGSLGNVFAGNTLEGLATGTNNGGAIYFGVGTTTATTPTAGIEASWGGGTNPQIHIGVTRDGNKTRFSAFADHTARIYTNSATERVRVDNNGQFNIISNTSTAPLVVNIGGSEVSRIDSSGRLLVGTSSARTTFYGTSITGNLLNIEKVDNAGATLVANFNDASARGFIVLAKSRGATLGSNTAVQSGDNVGELVFAGADGTQPINLASINAFVDGTPGTNDMPGRLVFSTTADGASSPTERFRITNDGVIVHDQPAPAAVNATATLTVANLKAGIITSTSAAATDMTLPTGTDTQAGFSGTYDNFTFEWSVINTGPSLVRVLAGTAHTVVGSGSVATGTSGRFASRRTAANTFVTYRFA
jgi:hypothetical protein